MPEMPKAYLPAEIEEKWYAEWEANKRFHGVPNPSKKPYSIVIPPPNVTGILTMGHVLNNTLQDILIRWHRMMGEEVCWFPGTDHAGIATESKVDKVLREKEGIDRRTLGREKFIERVWEWKKLYGGTIIKQLRKLGTSCDWDRERFTMDEGLSAAVRKVFVQLYEKGYIYRGKRMVNWCPAAQSALSDEEVIYREVKGKFWHFRYPLTDGSGYLVVATTRPETMFGDTAVAVPPGDPRYKHLVGKTVNLPLTDRQIPIIEDEHADPEKGTGCVKITPAHDPNDYQVGKRHNLEFINVMNRDGSMNAQCGKYAGLDRYECRKQCVADLEKLGLVEKIEDIVHNVGFSERGGVEIETLLSDQWFVRMDELAKPAIEAVRSGAIKFYPDRWTKTYFHWMENIQDWCISRQIWWGHRIPAWYRGDVNDENREVYVGMTAPEGDGWYQEEDVLDTWFSSWLWPFSIMGWPEDTPEQKFFYPTNDLVTGPDIIFFWVARMIMAGYEFKGELPFRNVYFTSIIRDELGRKLSKSLGNSPDPLKVIETYGADALRFSIVYIAPVGMDIRYSNEKCELGRNFANKLWNACRFRTMQGPVSESFDTLAIPVEKLTQDELHLLNTLEKACESVNTSLREFRFHSAAHDIYELVWNNFCDWFIEACKPRFNADDEAKRQALAVLDYALWKLLRLLHPFMPFITEELAHRMGFLADGQSIMTAAFPVADLKLPADVDKISEMTADKYALISAGRNLRLSNSIPPGKRIEYHIRAASQEISDSLCAQMDSLTAMLNASLISVSLENYASEDGVPAPSIVCDAGAIFLPLKGLVDPAAEREKLTKQKAELTGWIKAAEAKLGNEKFVSRAPAKVVEDVKTQLADLKDKLARVEESLAAFKG
ncbi:MAG: valine--tRNA ligase [Lentisphaeria bacterium]|nr:valine--tRNA ligase [Lentisphaeria bacterium]